MGIRVRVRVAARGLLGASVLIFMGGAHQLAAQRNRLAGAIEAASGHGTRVMLAAHVHPRATAENDQGRAEASMKLGSLAMVLKPSAEQQQALDELLARQQDASSPDFHHWLKPEEYADRFGTSQADVDKIAAWLAAQDLHVISVARGRNSISFSGSVRQVESAFQTEIHRYMVNGQLHYANATAPSVPAALHGMVGAIRGLHDFRPQARKVRYTSAVDGTNFLTPDDVATIYDVRPLLNSGIDGAGQKVAIVGQSQIDVNDIREFRTSYNLPEGDPQIILVPGLADPGISSGDQDESNLDIEWSGAVARKATIVFVYSTDVTDAVQYVIDQNLAPVLSMSYGLCESLTGPADLTTLRTWAQQANSQGITWLASSGDSGGADCFDPTAKTTATLDVDAPASVPEVTGVGGLEFNEGTGSWWKASNDGSLASATGYIPEMIWNDSVLAGSPASGGGGVSAVFPKPVWQTGPGFPPEAGRNVPDVSLSASAAHDGFLFYSVGARNIVGGTSVSAPVFAGMIALLNQYQVANGFQTSTGQGNINPQLYAMAVTNPGAFHDITVGNNQVPPCAAKVRNCTLAAIGYSAGPGYDRASGLGSVDAFNLVSGWHVKGVAKAAAALALTSSAASIPLTGSAVLTVVVTGANSQPPTGTVTWSFAGVALGSAALAAGNPLGLSATASLTVSASRLATGILSISAAYSGDATYAGAGASVSLTVVPSTPLTITGATNAASFKQTYAPGMIMAIFGTGFAGAAQSAPLVPLPTQLSGVNVTINGYLSPLYFISPGQINVQIPYNYFPVGPAVVKVNYNGQSATTNIDIAAAAPGIFADSKGAPVPNATAKRGDTIVLYVTGDGIPTPVPATGNVPTSSRTPKPVQTVGVTVGGAAALTPFVGIPSWSIGVTQVNYTVPATAPLGPQPVIVTVGTTQSAPATLTVTP